MPTKPQSPNIARRLRGVIGVNEAILDRVPTERPRYTKLGAIVCLTATFSALSMLVVTSQLFMGGLAWLVAVAFAVFWGGFVLVVDSWLISSTHGTRRGETKTLVYLPRLMVSVLLGFVIAEPVVILAFRPAIERQVAETRTAEIATDIGKLKECNPSTGEPVETTECKKYRLNLTGSPTTLRSERDDLMARHKTDSAALAQDVARWNEFESAARDECAGVPGRGSTGVRGEGSQCKYNRAVADQFRLGARLEQRQAKLAELTGRISDIQTEITATETSYTTQIKEQIKQKEDNALGQPVGILEEIAALGQLSDASVPVTIAHWALRLLLILFDCMPVLAKWMSGATAYDHMVRRRTDSDIRLHDKHLARREEIESVMADAHKANLMREPRATLDEHTTADRRASSNRERQLDEEIERLFNEYRR